MAKRSQRKLVPDAMVLPKDEREVVTSGNPLVEELLKAQSAVTQVAPYDGEIPGYVPSGSYLLNLLLSEGYGYPVTKLIHLTGLEGAGKTLLCLDAARSVLDMGGVVFWYNQEDGWSWATAEMMGVRKGHPNFRLFPPMLIEKCFDAIALNMKTLARKRSDTLVLFVIDSFGGSLTKDRDDKEVEKGRRMGDIQKIAKDFCAKLVPYMPFTNALVMITNHIYVDIHALSTNPAIAKPYRSAGGNAIPYRSWMELRVKAQAQNKTQSGKVLNGVIQVETMKNKGFVKNLKIFLPIYFKQRRNRVWGFDDGLTCVDFMLREEVWKEAQRDNRKVILVSKQDEIYGTPQELRDRYMADEGFREYVQGLVKAEFMEKFGLS